MKRMARCNLRQLIGIQVFLSISAAFLPVRALKLLGAKDPPCKNDVPKVA